MLNEMGANISGIGSNTLKIEGVSALNSISNVYDMFMIYLCYYN